MGGVRQIGNQKPSMFIFFCKNTLSCHMTSDMYYFTVYYVLQYLNYKLKTYNTEYVLT